jgi:carboxylesterase type B
LRYRSALTSAIGDLRFAHPKPAIYNSTTLNATTPGPACLQDARGQQDFFRGVGISEDCLTLNIMTPKGAANRTTTSNATVVGNAANNTGGLPVMVWM